MLDPDILVRPPLLITIGSIYPVEYLPALCDLPHNRVSLEQVREWLPRECDEESGCIHVWAAITHAHEALFGVLRMLRVRVELVLKVSLILFPTD